MNNPKPLDRSQEENEHLDPALISELEFLSIAPTPPPQAE